MDELLQRIMQAAPDFLLLNVEELAALSAYLSVPHSVTLSELKTNPHYREQHRADKDVRRHLTCVRNYNRELGPLPVATPKRETKLKMGRRRDTDAKKDAMLVDGWRASGLSMKDFALKRGLSTRQVALAVDRERHRKAPDR